MNNIITATNINKSFSINKTQTNRVLHNISIGIEKGKITALIGASGVGKSTLLYILGTLENTDTGEIILEINENKFQYSKCNDKEISKIRNKHIGFVFQFHHLLPEFTAFENIIVPGLIMGKNKTELEKKATELMKKFSLVNIKNQKPSELSGGEQQRTAIARALINEPEIIFADEPTGNLDSANTNNVIQLIKQVNSELKTTFLIATHNEQIASVSDKIIKMKDGKIEN
jgi:lipoprotein-releasing system ATP-binding protein